MTVDHVGKVFAPGAIGPRVFGRLCFPLVAALLADGFARTRSRGRYALRLAALALVAQGPFELAFGRSDARLFLEAIFFLRAPSLLPVMEAVPLMLRQGNVAFLLAMAVAALASLERRRTWPAYAAIALALFAAPVEYGLYGLALVTLAHLHVRGAIGGAALLLGGFAASAWVAWGAGEPLQAIAPASLVLVAVRPGGGGVRLRLPRLVYYAFYPAHLALLGAVRALVERAQG